MTLILRVGRSLLYLTVLLLVPVFLGGGVVEKQLRLEEIQLVIPQVDYEEALYYRTDDPLPYLDFEEVKWDRVVEKSHRAFVLENEYLTVQVLPEIGRVYSMVFRPTGNETLWHNDVVVPGRANNPVGWWLWLGGIEYTLPRDEHGTTWALPWKYELIEDSQHRKALRMEVREPLTGLEESITFSLYPGLCYLEAEIVIRNPGKKTAEFAHWVNPMWVPGGKNELTDHTEFILPTSSILVEERWQRNLGPSPQSWPGNPLRFIKNWKIGDIMANGLEAGFYGAYSHDLEEGVVRVFDPLKNPGVDIWTYGFNPQNIPMGSGAPNRGYVEMWGGTVKYFPSELGSIAAGSALQWTEWLYPFQKTSGLSYADTGAAASLIFSNEAESAELSICPTRALSSAVLELRSAGRTLKRETVHMTPELPYKSVFRIGAEAIRSGVTVILSQDGVEYLRFQKGN